jgi:hypothetical protein
LKSALASLRIDSYDAEKPVPVFTRMEMEVLIDPLIKAFKLATPDEDIAVAIEGAHSSAMGYQRTITTARLFLQDRDLHIVFGKLHAPIDDYDSPLHMEPSDRRLKPFVQGSRCLDGDRQFPVLFPFGTVHFFEQGDTVRKDRLVISLSGVHQPMGTPRATVMSLTNPSLPETAPPAVTDSDNQAPERKMPAGLPSQKLSIEERLRILKHLRDKDLITDQEYNDKKRDILDNL